VNKKFKQKKRKMNLECNKDWDGPHDSEFFRNFEKLLDEIIADIATQTRSEKHEARVETDKYSESNRGTRSSSEGSAYNTELQRVI